jgi:hypothetical protein
VGDTADGGVLATGLKLQDTESRGDDHALHLVVGRGNTFEKLDTVKSCSTASGLVSDHTTESLVEDAGGGAEVEWTTVGVDNATLVKVSVVLQLVTEEATRDVELFAADNDNLLSIEGLLSNDGSKTTEKMTLAVDDNDLKLRQSSSRVRWSTLLSKSDNGEQ